MIDYYEHLYTYDEQGNSIITPIAVDVEYVQGSAIQGYPFSFNMTADNY